MSTVSELNPEPFTTTTDVSCLKALRHSSQFATGLRRIEHGRSRSISSLLTRNEFVKSRLVSQERFGSDADETEPNSKSSKTMGPNAKKIQHFISKAASVD